MKTTLVFLFLLTTIILSQTTDSTFLIGDSLNAKSISIVKGWDFHSGDDSSWALPTFNSVGWDTVNTRLNRDSIKSDYWTGIGWFRKTIIIDSSLLNKRVGLVLRHYGASEIYLNGKFVDSDGTVPDSAENEIIYRTILQPIIVRFDSALSYTLAIRYSNH